MFIAIRNWKTQVRSDGSNVTIVQNQYPHENWNFTRDDGCYGDSS